MSEKNIKSGLDAVKDFISSLQGDVEIDKETLAAIIELQENGKLSKARLQKALEEKREKNE